MPFFLYLVPPGKRRGNPFWILRGEVGGRDIEVSTKTRDKAAAQEYRNRYEARLLAGGVPQSGEDISFADGVALYAAHRDPSKVDRARLERLKNALGAKPLRAIRHVDLVEAANKLHPGKAPATKNREVMRPAAAVLHYCAKNEFCLWLRVALFKEPRARTRAVAQDTARALIANLPDLPDHAKDWRAGAKGQQRALLTQKKKRLLLLWLFRQGPRISDALKIRGEDLDLQRRIVRRHIGKTDEWIEEPLHDEVWELLANATPGPGFLFPWRSKSGVYKWLRPYCQALGIRFTPHMARHSLGKWLNENGASLRQIMDTLHHADPKSSIRYQSTDIEIIRAAGRQLGRLLK